MRLALLASLAALSWPGTPRLGPQDEPRAPSPAEALAAAVRLPTREARRARADELAAREDVTLEAWVEAARAFGTFAPTEAGPALHRAELWTGGPAPEETEVEVYVPPGYAADEPAPLLLALHGTGGSGRGMHRPWKETADALGMLVVAPSETGPNVGYGWTERERRAALAALRWARLRWNVDEDRVFVTGVSRGGHLAWDLALRHPDRFAALAPMIGGPRLQVAGGQNNLRYLENVAHLPIRDLQGARDDEVLVFDLRLAFERLEELGAEDAELLLFEDLGHGFRMDAVDWTAWLGSARRERWPSRVVRAFAREGEGRQAWLEVLEADPEAVADAFVPSVREGAWERMDRWERLRWIQQRVDERTGRIAAEWARSGRVKVEGRGVRRFRVLFDEERMPRRGEALVTWEGRTRRVGVEEDAGVLLREFVERFDRGRVVVAEAVVE